MSALNIIAIYLDLLQVKHTLGYSSLYYEEHPHKNDLYGLSAMLTHYGVENIALRLEKSILSLKELEAPYIAHIDNDFGVVYKTDSEKVYYYYKGYKHDAPFEQFLNIWSGNVLVGEANENSIEPDYKNNQKKELIKTGEQIALVAAVSLLFIVLGIVSGFYIKICFISSLIINIAGLFISYLLILKQLKVNNYYANKICSLIKQGDCNGVLETDAAKFLNIFGWSEIGTGYFFANIVFIVCMPELYPYITLINIIVLPYTIWSIWYQKKVAKQWCTLCLLVQGVLWLIFLNNLLFGMISIPIFNITSILIIGCLYTIPVLLINLIIPVFSNAKKLNQTTHELNNFKSDKFFFVESLKSQPKYELNRDVGLFFGDPKAKHVITVVTNPHCSPCEEMHYRIENLLNRTNNGYCIQYILTSFGKDTEDSSKMFIAMYQQKDMVDFIKFMQDWYKTGKNNFLKFCEKYPFNKEDGILLIELNRQIEWRSKTDINSTPTILIDGYKLPSKYKIEDLIHFTNIEI